MDIVIITTCSRPELLLQTLESLRENSVDWSKHRLIVVFDGTMKAPVTFTMYDAFIINSVAKGASASRNIGASSIPRYRRQSHVMFLDDDVYMCPGWDARLEAILKVLPNAIVSGHAHPFNLSQGHYEIDGVHMEAAQVLSTVHYAMPWDIWDEVGFFKEPGGSGGSEDVDWCARAAKLWYGFAVTDPMCVIHCGLTTSGGEQIVGYDLMVEQNRKVVAQYGLEGKVTWI